ncbi:hypothetical protein ACFB49_42950 [Sphingomonas sp. DBB INV C78]|uniref:hypothetical protein n=1 Tax=Sphingomonas sp. DBB INV C78 TaxID=3349434 RepID=UPI0036D3516D
MQYLLTEEEMQAIRVDRDHLREAVFGDKLDVLVQHIACTMIETAPPRSTVWTGTSTPAYPKDRPHGCIHYRDPQTGNRTADYCDGCPVSDICRRYKEWSK